MLNVRVDCVVRIARTGVLQAIGVEVGRVRSPGEGALIIEGPGRGFVYDAACTTECPRTHDNVVMMSRGSLLSVIANWRGPQDCESEGQGRYDSDSVFHRVLQLSFFWGANDAMGSHPSLREFFVRSHSVLAGNEAQCRRPH